MLDWLLRFAFVRRLLIYGAVGSGLLVAFALATAYANNGLAVFHGVLGVIGVAGLVLVLWLLLRHRRRQRLMAQSLGDLLVLTPRAFEAAVADLLRDLGYRDVRQIGRSGDLAADIACRDRKGRSVVVQCKRYAPGARVGSHDMQSFIGMVSVHHRADRGIFVTTAEFTAPAVELARRHSVELFDGARLTRIIADLQSDGATPGGSAAADLTV